MDMDRLRQQIEFLVEMDKLKGVFRRTLLIDQSRWENSAEHSWHFALFAMVLSEYAHERVDLFKVMKMILVHDLVEIDAGDTYCYDVEANRLKAVREKTAADRIFSLLPGDQAVEFRALWEEFEECRTVESKFAAALDRLQPLLNNYRTGGVSWREHGVGQEQVYTRNSPIKEGAPFLWEYAAEMIRDAVTKGWIRE